MNNKIEKLANDLHEIWVGFSFDKDTNNVLFKIPFKQRVPLIIYNEQGKFDHINTEVYNMLDYRVRAGADMRIQEFYHSLY